MGVTGEVEEVEETQPAGLLESSRKPMDGCGGAALGDKAVRCSQIKPSAGSSWTCLYMHVLPLHNGTYILPRRPYLHVQTPPYLLQNSVRRCPKVREGAAKCGYGSAAHHRAVLPPSEFTSPVLDDWSRTGNHI